MKNNLRMTNELAAFETTLDQLCHSEKLLQESIDLRNLHHETQRIQQQWLTLDNKLYSDDLLKWYIKNHQFTLARIALKTQLLISKENGKKACSLTELKQIHPALPYLVLAIEDLSLLLEMHYKDYLDRNIRMPLCCLNHLCKRVLEVLPRFKKLVKSAGIETELIAAIVDPFNQLIFVENSQKIVTSHSILFRETIEYLDELTRKIYSKEDLTKTLINKLCYSNFNSFEVFRAIQQTIILQIKQLSKPSFQFDEWQRLQKHFTGMNVLPFVQFDPTTKSISCQLIEWIEGEMKKIPAEPSERKKSDEKIINASKIKTLLTVNQLGLLIQLGYETGIIPESQKKAAVVDIFAENFLSVSKTSEQHISSKSLYNAVYQSDNLKTLLDIKRLLRLLQEKVDHKTKAYFSDKQPSTDPK